MKNHQIMAINAWILIAIGLLGFIFSGSLTALIADGIGLILLLLSFPTKKENAIAAHIGVVITLAAAVTFWLVAFRRPAHWPVIIMAGLTSLAFVLYIISFITRKKEREAKKA